MKNRILLSITILMVALIQSGCIIGMPDRTLPKTLLSVKPVDKFKPKVYLKFNSFADKNLRNRMKTKAMEKCNFFDFVTNKEDADYIADIKLRRFDNTLISLAGCGVLPVPGSYSTQCTVKLLNKKGNEVTSCELVSRESVWANIIFAPLLVTPVALRSGKYSAKYLVALSLEKIYSDLITSEEVLTENVQTEESLTSAN